MLAKCEVYQVSTMVRIPCKAVGPMCTFVCSSVFIHLWKIRGIQNVKCTQDGSRIHGGDISCTLPSHPVTLLSPTLHFPLCRPQWSHGYHTCHWIRCSRFKPGRGRWIFSDRKNPEYDFIRKGNKAEGPVS